MPTTAPVKNIVYALAPEGTHVARVYKFMNLGTRQQQYQGVDKAYPDTLVTFSLELPNEMNEFEVEDKDTGEKKQVSKPFVVSREFTLSMGKKSNLRPFVEGVIGTSLTDAEAGEFDVEELVGMVCQVTIVHAKGKKDPDKTYANIKSVAPLMKGIEAPEAINKSVVQDVSVMSLEEIEELPNFLKDKMRVSDEYKGRFDPEEIARKKSVQEGIDKARQGGGTSPEYPEDEINPEDIPF